MEQKNIILAFLAVGCTAMAEQVTSRVDSEAHMRGTDHKASNQQCNTVSRRRAEIDCGRPRATENGDGMRFWPPGGSDPQETRQYVDWPAPVDANPDVFAEKTQVDWHYGFGNFQDPNGGCDTNEQTGLDTSTIDTSYTQWDASHFRFRTRQQICGGGNDCEFHRPYPVCPRAYPHFCPDDNKCYMTQQPGCVGGVLDTFWMGALKFPLRKRTDSDYPWFFLFMRGCHGQGRRNRGLMTFLECERLCWEDGSCKAFQTYRTANEHTDPGTHALNDCLTFTTYGGEDIFVAAQWGTVDNELGCFVKPDDGQVPQNPSDGMFDQLLQKRTNCDTLCRNMKMFCTENSQTQMEAIHGSIMDDRSSLASCITHPPHFPDQCYCEAAPQAIPNYEYAWDGTVHPDDVFGDSQYTRQECAQKCSNDQGCYRFVLVGRNHCMLSKSKGHTPYYTAGDRLGAYMYQKANLFTKYQSWEPGWFSGGTGGGGTGGPPPTPSPPPSPEARTPTGGTGGTGGGGGKGGKGANGGKGGKGSSAPSGPSGPPEPAPAPTTGGTGPNTGTCSSSHANDVDTHQCQGWCNAQSSADHCTWCKCSGCEFCPSSI